MFYCHQPLFVCSIFALYRSGKTFWKTKFSQEQQQENKGFFKGSYAKWGRFRPKISFFVKSSRTTYQIKSSSIAIFKVSADSIFCKSLLTRIIICFYLPYLSLFWNISCIHLINFIAQITLKWRRSGLVKFGSEKG